MTDKSNEIGASVASLNIIKKQPNPLRISKVSSAHSPLNKTFTLEDGKVTKTANAQLSDGTVEEVQLPSIVHIEKVITALQPNEALVLGITGAPTNRLTVSSKLTPELQAAGYVARTKDHFKCADRSLILLDYDVGEHMPYNLRCTSPAEVMALLAAIPELDGIEHLGISSSSAGITIEDTGQPYAAHGLHIYVEANNIDLDSFRNWLECALWKAGLGYISYARNGALLERFLIDTSVLSPERLIFEAAPTLGPGLTQAPREYEPSPGKLLAGPFEVSAAEWAEYRADVALTKQLGSVQGKAAKIREAYIKERGEVLAQTRGITTAAAQRIVRRSLECLEASQTLDADFLLDMGDHYVTVGDLLAQAREYDHGAMPDPIEGRSYGLTKAKFYYNDGNPIIHSFAHGTKTRYRLAGIERKADVPPAVTSGEQVRKAGCGLSQFSLNGSSAALAGRLSEDRYLIQDIALLGQCTAVYAPPNVGKSLIALNELVAAIRRHPELRGNIHYANADDTAAGLYEKLLIAEEAGFNMLAPGEKGFEIEHFLKYLVDICDRDQAAGQVVVLDTLKKFTDLMDKSKCAQFGKVVRRFVQKGGTMLLLGHANKRLGADGKPIPEGTGDIINDADCAYRMFEVERNDETQEKVVRLERIKARGNVIEAAHYRYSTARSVAYRDLLDSVGRLDESYVPAAGAEVPTYDEAAIIAAVVAAINAGINAKMALRDEVASRCNISRRQALIVIDRYTGSDPTQHRWSFKRVQHGRQEYTVLKQ